jgi:hypothetical protein
MPLPKRSAALLAVSFVAACSGITPTPTPSATASPTPSPSQPATASPSVAPSVSPSDQPAAVAVIKIDPVPGFIAPSTTFNRYPTVVLYGDGRLIMLGPQVELYPGPALPNLQVTQLTPAGVRQLLEWAAQAGLEGEDRFLGQPIPDAGVTQFSVVQPTGPHLTTVGDMSSDAPEIGALRKFQDIMLDVRAWIPAEVVGDDVAYDYDRLRVLVTPATAADMPDPSLVTVVDWPLQDPLATVGAPAPVETPSRCAVITGADLDALQPALEQANELTLWQSDGQTYSVKPHPLLPDEEACPA